MYTRMIPLGWFVRIFAVALLAMAVGLIGLSDPPAASLATTGLT